MPLFNKQPKTLSSFLDNLIEDKGWEEKLIEAKITDIWLEIVGESIAKNAKVIKLDDGVLTISTESSTWRNELRLRSDEIIDKLNKKINKDIIKKLKIK